jgi:ribosomal protein L16 Arg81 hydroxylase
MKKLKIINEIDVVEGISRQEFEERYYYPQKPVVIRNLVHGYPAFGKWNLDFFKHTMGHHEVGIFDGALEKSDRSYKEPDYHMRFGDYITEIQQGPTKKRLFLFNPFKLNEDLLKDFEFPKICNGFLKAFPFMFFGGDGSITRAHQDMDMSCVFLTQFEGKKRVVLFDPKYSTLLYRYPFNVHTGVNIDQPDFDKYPGLQYVTGVETILEYGDTLFMPSGWWHHIEYLGSGFGMSLRCLSPKMADRIKGGINVGLITHVDELMRKAIGSDWFQYKERKAIEKANKAISELQSEKLVLIS